MLSRSAQFAFCPVEVAFRDHHGSRSACNFVCQLEAPISRVKPTSSYPCTCGCKPSSHSEDGRAPLLPGDPCRQSSHLLSPSVSRPLAVVGLVCYRWKASPLRRIRIPISWTVPWPDLGAGSPPKSHSVVGRRRQRRQTLSVF